MMFWFSFKWTIITMIRFYGQFWQWETACDFQEKDDNFGEKQPQDEMDFRGRQKRLHWSKNDERDLKEVSYGNWMALN